jgi:UDP-N-acetylglucosamine--N-acetylmuramyl-(pentapeptide) pyrophosphoryl-undecaprenol N-acetylglucosamine transferase
MGGSLGADVLNWAVGAVAREGLGCSLLHLTGPDHLAKMKAEAEGFPTTWRVVGFEQRMDLFYAAIDCVVARAGGGVAEFTATATPSVLVPGGFGFSGHQAANAAALAERGAAVLIDEPDLATRLPEVVRSLLDGPTRARMAQACVLLAKPEAAATIAAVMKATHG